MDNFLEFAYNSILEKQDQLEIGEANYRRIDGNEEKDYKVTEEYIQAIIEIEAIRNLIRNFNINKGKISYE